MDKQYLNVIKTGNPFIIDDIVPHFKFGKRHISVKAFKVGDGLGVIINDITERKQAEKEREKLIHGLQEALGKVEMLSGLLPICANCKNIRDDKGYWSQIEIYIRDHSEADFSHSICPECAKKLYPDLDIYD